MKSLRCSKPSEDVIGANSKRKEQNSRALACPNSDQPMAMTFMETRFVDDRREYLLSALSLDVVWN